MTQRVLKGRSGVTMFLGIPTEQPLEWNFMEAIIIYGTLEEPTNNITLYRKTNHCHAIKGFKQTN